MKRLALLAVLAVFLFTVARAQELHRRPSDDDRIQKLEHQIDSLQRKVSALCMEEIHNRHTVSICNESWDH